MIFFTSDHHFYHENLFKKYCPQRNKIWKNIHEMNQGLIDRWNSVVSENDIVYYLGDIILGKRKVEELEFILDQLKGNIVFLRGNHDRYELLQKFFPIILDSAVLRIGNYHISMAHEGRHVLYSNQVDFGLCGHAHQNLFWTYEDHYWTHAKTGLIYHEYYPKPLINIGVDVPEWDFKPVSLNQVITLNEKILKNA